MRYRLIKDLPTFKAGQTFHTDAQGNLWLDEGQGPSNHWLAEVMAYHHRTIEHFPNILEDWFEEIEEPDPAYLVTKIQKLENSIKALDERLKTVEEITERLLREDNEQILGKVKKYEPGRVRRVIFERMKQDLRDWIEKEPKVEAIEIHFVINEKANDDRTGIQFVDAYDNRRTNSDILIWDWPWIGLTDGAIYTPDELLITGEAGKE